MSKIKNEIGNQYGRLTVFEFSHIGKYGACWKCLCECKKEIVISGVDLRRCHTKSCGCYQKERVSEIRFKKEIGNQYGRWKVLIFSHFDDYGVAHWLCQCNCKYRTKKIISGISLRSGNSISCGCYRKERTIESNSGQNNYNYRDGKSNKEYSTEWNNALRIFIRERDNHCCQFPNCDYNDNQEKRKLSVHHIDGDKNNCQEYNLISLCVACHRTVEFNPTSWQHYFYTITSDYEAR